MEGKFGQTCDVHNITYCSKNECRDVLTLLAPPLPFYQLEHHPHPRKAPHSNPCPTFIYLMSQWCYLALPFSQKLQNIRTPTLLHSYSFDFCSTKSKQQKNVLPIKS